MTRHSAIEVRLGREPEVRLNPLIGIEKSELTSNAGPTGSRHMPEAHDGNLSMVSQQLIRKCSSSREAF
ncbi:MULTISPECIES: hypothetical protein [unclassified Pseudoxanthomonas]|uniref:hypothetical protein n=1 Tax=unclassified Pseudoxanthomonas TaxID=2645906 RepID=UPI00307783CB